MLCCGWHMICLAHMMCLSSQRNTQEKSFSNSAPACLAILRFSTLPRSATGAVVVGCTGRGLFGVQDGRPVELDPQPQRGQRAQRAATGR